jgi:CPA1 family monovalent cation:H+ antiporter
MTLFELVGFILTIVALFGYVNNRFIKLPDTLGNMAVGLAASLALLLVSLHNDAARASARELMAAINFPALVLQGLLGLLLFAGSLHVNVVNLRHQKLPILLLSSVGVLISTVVVGVSFHYGLALLGQDIALVHCLMFGALISPTDPIAVMGVLKKVGAPVTLASKITGESLFNDGTAVVVFLLLLGLSNGSTEPTVAAIGTLFLTEVAGGVLLGLMLGHGAVALLKGMDSYPVEILTTLAVATGGYALAQRLHVSAPLAVVLAGLVVGHTGARTAMSQATRAHLFSFWELLDEILNLVLFGLIGMALLVLTYSVSALAAGVLAIPLVLAARWLSVAIPLRLSRMHLTPHAVTVLTWGGLRGGISVALALTLPEFEGRSTIVMATYCVVVFGLLVQGTTLGQLLTRLGLSQPAAAPDSATPGH